MTEQDTDGEHGRGSGRDELADEGDRAADERDALSEAREALADARDAMYVERTVAAETIRSAADERDAQADLRDDAANRRDLGAELVRDPTSGADDVSAAERSHARMNRLDSKIDRIASEHDRAKLSDPASTSPDVADRAQ